MNRIEEKELTEPQVIEAMMETAAAGVVTVMITIINDGTNDHLHILSKPSHTHVEIARLLRIALSSMAEHPPSISDEE
uniref:Uncharacterized protein n=1 Tax=viral metagenome TaxID=1070528 RepID=A0A6M3Y256_9ZZZZ